MNEREDGFGTGSPDVESECERRMDAMLAEAGLERASVHPELVERLRLLEERSHFAEDSRRIARGVSNVLVELSRSFTERSPAFALSPDRLHDAASAALIHDIGKTGPASATGAERELFVDLYAVENLPDTNVSIREVAAGHLANGRAQALLGACERLGIDPAMSMREFFDLHAVWTSDILMACPDGITPRAALIASSHHIDRGINPRQVPEGEVPVEAGLIGALEEYLDVLQERALMAVDKYEAVMRRAVRHEDMHVAGVAGGSHATHDEAMKVVRAILARKFSADPLTAAILDAVDSLGRDGRIFAEAAP